MAIFVFFALGVIFLLGFVLGQQFFIARSQRQGLLRAASQFGGRLEDFSWFELPRIRMWKRNFEAIVQYWGSGNIGLTTTFRIAWTDSDLECEVRRRRAVESIAPFMQEHPIDLAAPLLDDSYLVTGNDESRIRSLFSARVQTALINILALPVPFSLDRPDVQFSIADGLVTVTKSGRLTDSYALEIFIRLCAEMHDAALAAAGRGGVGANDASESKSCA